MVCVGTSPHPFSPAYFHTASTRPLIFSRVFPTIYVGLVVGRFITPALPLEGVCLSRLLILQSVLPFLIFFVGTRLCSETG